MMVLLVLIQTWYIYITIESYPNLGSATINISCQEFSMNYADGVDAHWYYSIPLLTIHHMIGA